MLGADGGLDPTAIQGSVVGILAFVVWWFIRSTDRSYNDDRTDRDRLAGDKASLEVKLAAASEEIVEQRKLKHEAINRQAAAEGTLSLVRRSAHDCTCGAMTALLPLLEERT